MRDAKAATLTQGLTRISPHPILNHLYLIINIISFVVYILILTERVVLACLRFFSMLFADELVELLDGGCAPLD